MTDQQEIESIRRAIARVPSCAATGSANIGPAGQEGPVGMPGPRGQNADGTPGETEEEHRQRWRDAIAHNERYFDSLHPMTDQQEIESIRRAIAQTDDELKAVNERCKQLELKISYDEGFIKGRDFFKP